MVDVEHPILLRGSAVITALVVLIADLEIADAEGFGVAEFSARTAATEAASSALAAFMASTSLPSMAAFALSIATLRNWYSINGRQFHRNGRLKWREFIVLELMVF